MRVGRTLFVAVYLNPHQLIDGAAIDLMHESF